MSTLIFYKPTLEEGQIKGSKSERHMDWQVDSLVILRHHRHMDPRGGKSHSGDWQHISQHISGATELMIMSIFSRDSDSTAFHK